MGIYIPGVKLQLAKKYKCDLVLHISYDGTVRSPWGNLITDAKAVELPPHGRLGDLDELRRAMYHEAFETDSPMQKWDSGCWIRYKLFERMEEAAPTIIPADPEEGGTDR